MNTFKEVLEETLYYLGEYDQGGRCDDITKRLFWLKEHLPVELDTILMGIITEGPYV